MEIALIAFLAFVNDCTIGDPNSKYHPVALMGKLIDILDKLLRKDNATEPTKLVCGFILVAILLALFNTFDSFSQNHISGSVSAQNIARYYHHYSASASPLSLFDASPPLPRGSALQPPRLSSLQPR